MFGHHAAHRGAVAAVIILLNPARFLRRNLEPAAYELADPLVDLLPQVDVMRIERVVEVEDPGVDVGKGAGLIIFLPLSCPRRRASSTPRRLW
jgi:hypothetical protein